MPHNGTVIASRSPSCFSSPSPPQGNYESLRTKFEVQRAQAEAALQQELTAHEHAEQRHRAALAQLEEQLRRLGDERDAAVVRTAPRRCCATICAA